MRCNEGSYVEPNVTFHEGGKVGRSNATPIIFFSLDSYDMKSSSLKFGNDTFITFEMPRVSFKRPVGKIRDFRMGRVSGMEISSSQGL